MSDQKQAIGCKKYRQKAKTQRMEGLINNCNPENTSAKRSRSTKQVNSDFEDRFSSSIQYDSLSKVQCNSNFDGSLTLNEAPEVEKLRQWIVDSRIPHSESDNLLKILRKRLLPDLPKTTVAFLKDNKSECEIIKIEAQDDIGEFCYFDIKEKLQCTVNLEHHPSRLQKALGDLNPLLNQSVIGESDPLKIFETGELTPTTTTKIPSDLNPMLIDDAQQFGSNFNENTNSIGSESVEETDGQYIHVNDKPAHSQNVAKKISLTSTENMSEVVEIKGFDVGADLAIEILQDIQLNVTRMDERLDVLDKNQRKIMKFMLNKNLTEIEDADLENTYDLKIPFETLQEFDEFEKQVKDNELLKADVCVKLSKCIDTKNCALTKSFASMLRLFLTKHTISYFTAIRKSKKTADKRIFISTSLFKLMSEIMVETRKSKNLSCEIGELQTALSEVISHSGQWTEKKDESQTSK